MNGRQISDGLDDVATRWASALLHTPIAYAVHTADMQGLGAYPDTDMLMSDVLTEIGTPLPCNLMPDPEALNSESAFESKGHINALNRSCPSMKFNAGLAVLLQGPWLIRMPHTATLVNPSLRRPDFH